MKLFKKVIEIIQINLSFAEDASDMVEIAKHAVKKGLGKGHCELKVEVATRVILAHDFI